MIFPDLQAFGCKKDSGRRVHAVATTAENGEDGSYYLAVLIAYQPTAKSQVGVDYRGQNTVKFVQNEKYSAKSADFLRFLLYLCHVINNKTMKEIKRYMMAWAQRCQTPLRPAARPAFS